MASWEPTWIGYHRGFLFTRNWVGWAHHGARHVRFRDSEQQEDLRVLAAGRSRCRLPPATSGIFGVPDGPWSNRWLLASQQVTFFVIAFRVWNFAPGSFCIFFWLFTAGLSGFSLTTGVRFDLDAKPQVCFLVGTNSLFYWSAKIIKCLQAIDTCVIRRM